MSFDISQVLNSSMSIGASASSESQFSKNAKEAITSVIKEFAGQLFNDAQFMTENGWTMLNAFKELKFNDQEFSKRTTSLEEQIEVVAHLCHSRNLKAHEETRALTAEEREEISQAIQNLAAAHAGDKELSAKLAILEEVTPTIIKMSEAYTRYILPFDQQLQEHFDTMELPEHVKRFALSCRSSLFPEAACTRQGLKAIEEADAVPEFESVDYGENIKALSNYILHLALVSKNEGRGMNASEIEAVGNAIKMFRDKMGLVRESNMMLAEIVATQKSLEQTTNKLYQLPGKQKEKTAERSAIITDQTRDLQEYNKNAAYVAKYEQHAEVIAAGRKEREDKLEALKKELVDFTKKCTRLQQKLTNEKAALEQKLQETQAKREAFVNENFSNPAALKAGIALPENEFSMMGYLMRYPEVVAQGAELFIDHLTSKVNRLPEEKQASRWLPVNLW